MTTIVRKLALVALCSVVLAGCANMSTSTGWAALLDGSKTPEMGLENFTLIGEANVIKQDGVLASTKLDRTPAYLVSKESYTDFTVRVEFWASDDANSGVFLRCQDSTKVTDENCYEANIFDQRPDPTYGTGAIVKVAKAPEPMPKAGGKWNTYEITAKSTHLTLILNGIKTVDIEDKKLSSGPIALQLGSGTIKFRKVEIKKL